MNNPGILDDILKELKRLKKVQPSFPDHVSGQAGIVVVSAGQLMRAAQSIKYGKASEKQKAVWKRIMIKKATETAANAIRLIQHLTSNQDETENKQRETEEVIDNRAGGIRETKPDDDTSVDHGRDPKGEAVRDLRFLEDIQNGLVEKDGSEATAY